MHNERARLELRDAGSALGKVLREHQARRSARTRLTAVVATERQP